MNGKESGDVLGQGGSGRTGDKYVEVPAVFVTPYFLK